MITKEGEQLGWRWRGGTGRECSPDPGCGGHGGPPRTGRGQRLGPVMSAVLRHLFTSFLVKRRLSSILKYLQGDRRNLALWVVLVYLAMTTCKVKNLFPRSRAFLISSYPLCSCHWTAVSDRILFTCYGLSILSFMSTVNMFSSLLFVS